jgi:hypothetical protein
MGARVCRWKKEWAGKLVTTTVFVPLEGAERLILIHSEGSGVVSHWIKDSPEEEFSLEELYFKDGDPELKGS